MKLPHAEEATVETDKAVRYLLSPDHPRGGSKAVFFLRFGFRATDSEGFIAALRKHVHSNDIAKTEDTVFGTRYIVEGALETPDGRRPQVRVIWFVDHGMQVPRFTTAYPLHG